MKGPETVTSSNVLPLNFEEPFYVVPADGGRPQELRQLWLQVPEGTVLAAQPAGVPAGTWWVKSSDVLADVDLDEIVDRDAYVAAMTEWTAREERQRAAIEDVARTNSETARERLATARSELLALGLSVETVNVLIGVGA